ncbi:hypothetical protein PYJP_13790 [Pyrofollis japonicus]|uniref:hypothetical protein n=1 Tax=Pyrofollis japonicus TaxID=3060460 RepID=UPI00295B9DE2|nr:hypothetical protein [Pyrofollis japonicus]BEP18027.1 hypothetical protein PYJP_13790 [Pyrofollis japonicus]
MADEPEAPISARIEYRRAKKIVELDAKVFKPCNVKELEKGLLHKNTYLIHFDGEKWDILRITSKGEIERYILR